MSAEFDVEEGFRELCLLLFLSLSLGVCLYHMSGQAGKLVIDMGGSQSS